jgi:leader peptidase (prepilin peptidase)/N-methyltransferase
MITILTVFIILIAMGLLVTLSIIDLKHGILPDKLNLALGVCGAAFHFTTGFVFENPQGMIMGALIGGGFLYVIRFFADRFYRPDSLGLGDVKLLMAAGVWLGPEDILIAIIAGGVAGVVHGIGIAAYRKFKTAAPLNLNNLSLPAGPGFVAGIIIAAALKFYDLPAILFS